MPGKKKNKARAKRAMAPELPMMTSEDRLKAIWPSGVRGLVPNAQERASRRGDSAVSISSHAPNAGTGRDEDVRIVTIRTVNRD